MIAMTECAGTRSPSSGSSRTQRLTLINAGPSRRGWHRLEAAARCGQLYGWGYGRPGSTFGPTFPLVRGSLGHVGLAHAYSLARWIQEGHDPADSPYYQPLDAVRLAAEPFGELGRQALPTVERTLRAYGLHWGSEPFRIVGIEEEVETSFDGWPYTARLDLVVEDTAGKVWILDHKFVSRIEAKVLQRYTLSGQFLGFQWIGHRRWGEAFGGVRLNLVGCAAPGFVRVSPEPAPWMLARFPRVVAELEEKIARIEAALAHGNPLPAAPSEHTCWTSYGPCPAFDLCRWGPDQLSLTITDSDDPITPVIGR